MKTHIEPFALAMLLANAFPALAATHYVDANSTSATPPYTNWACAATTIQEAVDAAVAGDQVVVANGIYWPVSVNKALNVRSVNGPQVTTIDGGGACRCVSLAANASLSGFTLTNGVSGAGGGAYGGTLTNCTLTGNSAFTDGSQGFYSLGGGAAYCTLNNCAVRGNSAIARNYVHAANEPSALGGGAFGCTLNNCVLSGNSASASSDFTVSGASGGGANNCELNNCTVTGNSASATSGNLSPGTRALGAGAYASTLNNCISFGNNYADSPGNRTCEDCGGDPGFVDTNGWANLRLQSNSPYINAGNNAYAPAGPDLDGNPRIVGGTVDLGAYEFQSPVSKISYAWLQQFNLPINPATDTADADGDGVDNWHEWLAGTDPTNRFSSPAQLTIIPSGSSVILSWSTNAVGFILQSTSNLNLWGSLGSVGPGVITNGQNTVTVPIFGPQQFFRLRLQPGGSIGGCITDSECPPGYVCIGGSCHDRQ